MDDDCEQGPVTEKRHGNFSHYCDNHEMKLAGIQDGLEYWVCENCDLLETIRQQ